MKTIAILGALDTKGQEFAFLSRCDPPPRSPDVGHRHTSVIGEPIFKPTIPASEVITAGGSSLEVLRTRADRGFAMQILGSRQRRSGKPPFSKPGASMAF